MTFPQFATVSAAPARVKRLLSWLDACGWEADDVRVTVSGDVQVRLIDQQDINNFEHCMRMLNNGTGQ